MISMQLAPLQLKKQEKRRKVLKFWILDLKVCLKKLGLGPVILKILSCIYCKVSNKETIKYLMSDTY